MKNCFNMISRLDFSNCPHTGFLKGQLLIYRQALFSTNSIAYYDYCPFYSFISIMNIKQYFKTS